MAPRISDKLNVAFTMAFSFNTPEHAVQFFRDGLQRLYSDGRYEAISRRRLGR